MSKNRDGGRKLGGTDLRRHVGFTLVELLVVIAIIGVLVALLLPAVQAAREAARRSACQNNFKQLGLALAMYESDKGQYPEGAHWSGGPTNYRGSMLVRLLPYVEQQAIYELFDFTSNTDFQTVAGTSQLIGELTVEVYQCPSDDYPLDLEHNRGLHNYAGLKGASRHINNGNCSCRTFSTWNSFALSSYENFHGPNDYAGVFTRLAIATERRHITDGLSQTAFMGEVRPMCSVHAANGWAMSNNGQGLTSTISPINFNSCNRDRIRDGCQRPCNWNMELGVKSSHPGGAFLLFGDGSVRFKEESIDMWAYQYLGAKADGEVIGKD